MKTFITHLALIGTLLGAAAPPVAAQSPPSGPVTVVVPYGPGGNADLAARALGASLREQKDVAPIMVVNRAGANGVTGSVSVINAPRDGKTLLMARVGSQVVAPALDPSVPYTWDSLTPIGLLEVDPYVCLVARNSPYKSAQDLITAIRAQPGKLSYSSSGTMDASVVFPTRMLLNAGLKADAALMVPYKSAAEALTAVLGGQVDFTCNGLGPYMGTLTGGQSRGIVISTTKRMPQLPDVPTAEEIGMRNLEQISGWSALFGPPGMSKDTLDRWADLLTRVARDPRWVEGVKARGAEPSVLGPEETRRFVEQQFQMYRSMRDLMKTGN